LSACRKAAGTIHTTSAFDLTSVSLRKAVPRVQIMTDKRNNCVDDKPLNGEKAPCNWGSYMQCAF
jgi:hypothetical protein